MSDPDGFLARWSRRKVEARVGPASPPSEVSAADGAPTGETGEVGPAPSAAITAEELAALPPPESLTAESDLGPFLRTGVPALLRNAALRRMWAVDPAIRDFVGEARDYSWDWNVAGGVPGHGPLLPGDEPAAILARMFGDRVEPDAEPPIERAGEGADPGSDAREEAELASQPPGPPANAEPEPERAAGAATSGAGRGGDGVPPGRNRRHGGAVPL